jgi:membrane-associated protease RseP (regulator of RpoE activity)
MSTSALVVLFVCVSTLGLFVLLAVVAVTEARRKGEKPSPPPVPAPTSLSLLAGLSFFCGLGAVLLATVTGLLSHVVSMGDLLQVPSDARTGIDLAGKIVLYVSLLPAVGAIAFALAARGVISESQGTVRGRPLYRTGILLAIVTGVVVLDAKILNPQTWASAGRSIVRSGRSVDEAELHRGYLGVELEGPSSVRVARVVPGSPAEGAGVQVGDWITKLDGMATTTGSNLIERIGSIKPGSRISVEVRRGAAIQMLTADLVSTFAGLQWLLEQQDLDGERLTVLKAKGLDHRYSADELTKICECFDFDEGRLKAIEKALPLLQDPQNAYRILGALRFGEAKAKVSGWIAERAQSPKKE